LHKKTQVLSLDNSSTINSFRKKFLGSSAENFIETKSDSPFYKNNNNKGRIIIVDDDQDIVFTYEFFLKDVCYEIISFTDPSDALNYIIRDLPDFNNLLIILDIRMKNLNGFQLHQQIKAIDPTIKFLFVIALDILDELSSIVPGISKEQIMRKPVDKVIFINTVKKLLNQ
jgi:DNA-binding NtrC family response regulator